MKEEFEEITNSIKDAFAKMAEEFGQEALDQWYAENVPDEFFDFTILNTKESAFKHPDDRFKN